MFDKLTALKEKFKEIERKMADPKIAADPEEMRKLGKSHADLLPIVTAIADTNSSKATKT